MNDDAFVEPPAMQHCVEILTAGYVQSFVDFFYLTNKEPSAGQVGQGAKAEPAPSVVTESKGPEQDEGIDLALVSERLTAAEKARRSGNPEVVFENYEALADYYAASGSAQTSVHFFTKCLKLAQLVNDAEREKQATFKLAQALSTIKSETEQAIQHHERHLRLATESRDEAACARAREELIAVYDRRAAELEDVDIHTAVALLEKLLKLATESKALDKKAAANFRLGKAFNQLGKPERAIVALTQSLDYAQLQEDIRAQGEACAALADAYLLVESKTAKAVEYLQETRKIAIQNGDNHVQSRACRKLGSVFTKAGDHEQAVRFYEQHFELTRKEAKLGATDLDEVDHARVLLGVALKNARRSALRKMVRGCNVNVLLTWKTAREFAAEY